MLIDWNDFLPKVKGSVKALADASPETIVGYRQICAFDAKSGHLDEKTRELISLAVAVTTRSDGCIANHTKRVIELGATREEVADAMGVAVAMNAGAAVTYAGRVMDAFSAFSNKE
ncbi:MAG TPA: carboxymuconolactone decarboxylase family protein [Roseiarcus sp.]|jgi:AhpD family alkylhydroperoxidase